MAKMKKLEGSPQPKGCGIAISSFRLEKIAHLRPKGRSIRQFSQITLFCKYFVLTWVLINLFFLPAVVVYSNDGIVKEIKNEKIIKTSSFAKIVPIKEEINSDFEIDNISDTTVFSIIWIVFCLISSAIFLLNSNKKGILLTLGLSFLALSILSLSIIMFHNLQESEEITSKLVIFDRVYELDHSIQDSLKDIFIYGSGIDITINESNVTVQQVISNSNGANYNRTLILFKKFVEADFRNVMRNVSNTSNDISFRILPQNMDYIYNLSANTTSLIPSSINFDFYELNFSVSGANVTAPSGCGLSSGTLTVDIYSTDTNGNSYSCLNDVDPSNDVTFTIPTTGGDITVEIDGDNGGGILIIDSAVSVAVNTTINVGFGGTQEISVGYPEDMININFNEFGVNKSSTVTLY